MKKLKTKMTIRRKKRSKMEQNEKKKTKKTTRTKERREEKKVGRQDMKLKIKWNQMKGRRQGKGDENHVQAGR